MNNSKLKSAFGIDDILYQNQKASSKLAECLNGRLDRNSAECSGSRSTMSDGSQSNFQSDIYGNQLKKPLALFPPIMDFSKPNFCISGLPRSFSPTSYLEQYASALTKASPRLWPFYPHPYGSYLLPTYNFKRKGGQVRFTPQQTTSLERRFSSHKYLSPEDRKHLAHQLKLSDRQVKTWFQNRRAKWRRSNSATAVTDSQQAANYLQYTVPLNLQKHKSSNSIITEKEINVTTSDTENTNSDDDGDLEINLNENET